MFAICDSQRLGLTVIASIAGAGVAIILIVLGSQIECLLRRKPQPEPKPNVAWWIMLGVFSLTSLVAGALSAAAPGKTCDEMKIVSLICQTRSSDPLNEYVLLHNEGKSAAKLDEWTLCDALKKNCYKFEDFILAADGLVEVWTKSGEDDEKILYWNSGTPIWNNDGDIVHLIDKDGNLIDEKECAPLPPKTIQPHPTPTPLLSTSDESVNISKLICDPYTDNPLDEFVTLHNDGEIIVDMNHWTICNGELEEIQNCYEFINIVLEPDDSIELWTKSGVDSEVTLYWNSKEPVWTGWKDWSNGATDVDTAFLRDETGKKIDGQMCWKTSPDPIRDEPSDAPKICCKYCTVNSKPCGDTCISLDKICHKGPGCACRE